MASCPKPRSELLMFKADTPHFFKVIIDDSIRAGKIGIPKNFIRKFGNSVRLSSPMVLKVPTGAKWKIELKKCDGVTWLTKGWQEFVEYYSLAHGYFLVFQYDQESCFFNIIIFDKSASEIDYPFGICCDQKIEDSENEEQKIGDSENEASVLIMDDFPPCRKRKEKPSLRCSRFHQKMKVENPRVKLRGKEQKRNRIAKRMQALGEQEKTEACHRASSNFKTNNPFFMIMMQTSYVYPSTQLSLPESYARKFFNQNKVVDATLIGVDGRTWPVKYYRGSLDSTKRSRPKIAGGWMAFAKENHLEVGDVCIFEMIKAKNTTFKVSISRRTRGENKRWIDEKVVAGTVRKASCSSPPKAIEAAKDFTSVHPFFKLIIPPSHLEHVHVPHRFIRNIKQGTEKAKLQVGNSLWPVKVVIYPHYSKGSLAAGWGLFARENSLQAGDVCFFELIDSEAVLINVSIFRYVG